MDNANVKHSSTLRRILSTFTSIGAFGQLCDLHYHLSDDGAIESTYDEVERERPSRAEEEAHRRRQVLEEVALQILVEEEAEPERRSSGRAPVQRSGRGAPMVLSAADKHVVGRTAATRLAARHLEQPNAACPKALATRTPTGAPSPCWSLVH
jgi:hypothetical protein